MLEDCVSYGHIDESNIYWRRRETEAYVIVVSWPSMFTTFMAGAGRPVIGESITSNYDVFAENATLTDMRNEANT